MRPGEARLIESPSAQFSNKNARTGLRHGRHLHREACFRAAEPIGVRRGMRARRVVLSRFFRKPAR